MLQRLSTFALLFCLPGLALAVDQFSYRVLDKKPQDRRNFVQGLEIHNNQLYVSAGNYGKSRLLRYDFTSGEVETEQRLHPKIFAEGLTVLGDRVYQLTWREKMMLVFNRDDLKALEWFPIPGQGWGLTNNGKELIYSDGSDRLHFVSPESQRIRYSLAVTENEKPVRKLNELEWINGKIWANIWQSDRIVIIDPESGEVQSSIDLSGLLPTSERRADTDVLNGIAVDPLDGGTWVTGKRWPWLYRIELIPKDQPQSPTDSR